MPPDPDGPFPYGLLAIDMACTKRKIAIEFDGPSHFLKELKTGKLTRVEDGAIKSKRRYLQKLGWTVINLDYRDYTEARKTKNEKDWLRQKLEAVGAI